MENTNNRNIRKRNISDSRNKREEMILENLDIENIFALLRLKNSDTIAILDKVKVILSLLIDSQRYNYLQSKCMQKSNGGTKVIVGSTAIQDYRLISIRTEAFNSVRNTIMGKLFSRYEYYKNIPGTIKGFSLKKANLRPDYWENNAEINILGDFGKEYYVKINFFTYN